MIRKVHIVMHRLGYQEEITIVKWNNLDTLSAFANLEKAAKVSVKKEMAGENGALRVKKYSVPMAEGLAYNYAAKAVNDELLDAFQKLADEAELAGKFEELYNGEVSEKPSPSRCMKIWIKKTAEASENEQTE